MTMESLLGVHEYRRGLNALSQYEQPVALSTLLYSPKVYNDVESLVIVERKKKGKEKRHDSYKGLSRQKKVFPWHHVSSNSHELSTYKGCEGSKLGS